MKLFTKTLLAGSILISLSSTSFAQVTPLVTSPYLDKNNYGWDCFERFSYNFWDVYYVNGQITSLANATSQYYAVRNAFRDYYKPYTDICGPTIPSNAPDNIFRYYLQYNATAERINLISDSFETVALTNNIAQVRLFQNIFEERTPLTGQEGEEALTPAETSLLTDMLFAASDTDQLNSLVDQWERTLTNPQDLGSEQRCPLVIGYSQGSLIVNRAMKLFELSGDPQCTTTIHIGSPDSVLEGDASSYITAEQDGVINAIRDKLPLLNLPEPLAPNVDNGFPNANGHSLIKDYLEVGSNNLAGIQAAFDQSTLCSPEVDPGGVTSVPECENVATRLPVQ